LLSWTLPVTAIDCFQFDRRLIRPFQDNTMKTTLRKVGVLIGLLLGVGFAEYGTDTVMGQASCGLQLNQAPVIFCDTFNAPSTVFNRSGQMNGTIWGVSRQRGGATEWHDATLDGCNGPQPASPIGATDVIICNGQLRTVMDDDHDVATLAMYPKQPFDWSGRTGTVGFDVTNDTTGSHGAWPEFWITDLPIPAPSAHLIPCDMCTFSRHALGIRFAANQGECPDGWRADSAIVVRDWVAEDRNIFENNTSGMKITQKGCVSLSSGPNGGLNHIEIRISQNTIDVYASDAGSRTLKLINQITNANLSFSRGLIWIQDAHYNAEKAHIQTPSYPNQKMHTYAWDNVAFDGPATYRDLSFDVLDRNNPLTGGNNKTGWDIPTNAPATMQTLPMTSQNISAATRAFLLFNYGKDTNPTTFNYTINGNVNTAPDPHPPTGFKYMRSAALPIPLNQLVNGPNTITMSADTWITVGNVNIVLVAAAPVPGAVPPTPPSNLRILR
jgi:hypothetical protein